MSYPIGIDEAFYSVGDVTRSRISQRLGDQMRDFSLPLVEVQPPAPFVKDSGWSWAALGTAFSTWGALSAAFATCADAAANNRKPGC